MRHLDSFQSKTHQLYVPPNMSLVLCVCVFDLDFLPFARLGPDLFHQWIDHFVNDSHAMHRLHTSNRSTKRHIFH